MAKRQINILHGNVIIADTTVTCLIYNGNLICMYTALPQEEVLVILTTPQLQRNCHIHDTPSDVSINLTIRPTQYMANVATR
jgi:hypothetical protein